MILGRTLVMGIVMAGCGGTPAMPDAADAMAMLAATDASGAPLTSSVSLPFSTGLFTENMALSTTGRLAVVGTFMLSEDAIYRGGWVQVYGP